MIPTSEDMNKIRISRYEAFQKYYKTKTDKDWKEWCACVKKNKEMYKVREDNKALLILRGDWKEKD